MRIDVVEPRGLDQRVHHRGALAAAIGPGEQPRLAAEHNLAAGINEQTLKAAAALKNPQRLKQRPLRMSHASLHPWKERE